MSRSGLWGALGLAGTLLLWHLLATAEARPAVFPTPSAVVATLLSERGDLASDAIASASRVVFGFSVAAAVALPLGFGMGARRRLADELGPLFAALRPIPPFAWLPLVLLAFGIGERGARTLVFVGALFPILLAAERAVAEVPPALTHAGRSLGARGFRLFWRVQLPAALPGTLTGLRLGWSVAWMSVVAAELVGTDGGLGQRILDARNLARPDLAIAGMVVLGTLAAGSSVALTALERRLVRG